MKSEMKKWFVTVLAVAVILTVGTVEAGYVQQDPPDTYEDEDDPAHDHNLPYYIEDAGALVTADEDDRECTCTADTYTMATTGYSAWAVPQARRDGPHVREFIPTALIQLNNPFPDMGRPKKQTGPSIR